MKFGATPLWLGFLLAATAGTGLRGWAVILPPSDQEGRHVRAPEGELAGSGWQWQGIWQGYSGTPISSSLFLTARHVGGSVGQALYLNGRVHQTVAVFPDPDPESDLVLWKVCPPFPDWAPLVAKDEALVSVPCVVFGRGMLRGSAVTMTNQGEVTLRGWKWSATDTRLRWGLNVVMTNDLYLQATFDPSAGPDEATLAAGDSGGGLFVQQAGEWRLAGIHYGVDGPFRYGEGSPEFLAALFDRRGFEEKQEEKFWRRIDDQGDAPQPASFYSSNIALRRGWIDTIVRAAALPTLEQAAALGEPFAPVINFTVEGEQSAFHVPEGSLAGFFRLNACQPTEITSALPVSDGMRLEWKWAE